MCKDGACGTVTNNEFPASLAAGWKELEDALRASGIVSDERIASTKTAFYGGAVVLMGLLAGAESPEALDAVLKTTAEELTAHNKEIEAKMASAPDVFVFEIDFPE
jgi:hypothetical protein